MSKLKVVKVQGISINYHRIEGEDYINLTDIARSKDAKRSELPIQNWINTNKTIAFLLVWEKKNNPDFKHVQTPVFKGYEKFSGEMLAGKKTTVTKWRTFTNAKGVKVIRGRYGGTFAHRDIAFHFANWLDAEFYLYMIEEFQRLQVQEFQQLGDPFDVKRNLTAGNHTLLMASILTQIDERLLTHPQPYKSRLHFASEVDLINEIVFGMTAQEWRRNNTDKPSDRNMRDYATILEITLYSNLEVVDAMLIQWGCEKEERKDLLKQTYDFMFNILKRAKPMKRMQEGQDNKLEE